MLVNTFTEAYTTVLNNNKSHNLHITIVDPTDNIINVPQRNLNYKQLLGLLFYHLQGKSDLDSLIYYNKSYSHFSDDGESINGMIGNRIFAYEGLFDIYQDKENNEIQCEHIIVDQFQECFENIKNFYNIQCYNPILDKHTLNSCNISNIIFNKNMDKLDLTINVIYLDFYYRFPYLSFFISNLLFIMASRLNLKVGNVYMNINNLINYKQIKLNSVENKVTTDVIYYDADKFTEMFDIELMTRIQGDLINKKEVKNMIYGIQSPYWQSIVALLVIANTKIQDFEKFVLPEHKFIIDKVL